MTEDEKRVVAELGAAIREVVVKVSHLEPRPAVVAALVSEGTKIMAAPGLKEPCGPHLRKWGRVLLKQIPGAGIMGLLD